MEQLWGQYRPDDLFLFDDLFTLRRENVLAVCREIQNRNLSFHWSAQGRVGLVDLELLSVMKESGCTELLFGVESGSNRILSFLEKGFTRDEVIKTFTACHQVGLSAGAYIIIGVPGEKKEDIDLTIDLIKQIKPNTLNFSFLTPFPNTKLYQLTNHLIAEKRWTEWNDFTQTIYQCQFEISPEYSRQMILDNYCQLIKERLVCSPYQLLE